MSHKIGNRRDQGSQEGVFAVRGLRCIETGTKREPIHFVMPTLDQDLARGGDFLNDLKGDTSANSSSSTRIN